MAMRIDPALSFRTVQRFMQTQGFTFRIKGCPRKTFPDVQAQEAIDNVAQKLAFVMELHDIPAGYTSVAQPVDVPFMKAFWCAMARTAGEHFDRCVLQQEPGAPVQVEMGSRCSAVLPVRPLTQHHRRRFRAWRPSCPLLRRSWRCGWCAVGAREAKCGDWPGGSRFDFIRLNTRLSRQFTARIVNEFHKCSPQDAVLELIRSLFFVEAVSTRC